MSSLYLPIRQTIGHYYGADTLGTPDRNGIAAHAIERAVIDHLRALSPGEHSDLMWGAHEGAAPPEPDTGTARTHDPEPLTYHDTGPVAISGGNDDGETLLRTVENLQELGRTVHGQRLSAEGHARRTTNLEENLRALDERLTNQINGQGLRLSDYERSNGENHHAILDRQDALERILHRHRQELDYLSGEADTLPAADPDQRLGGHDNPHHHNPDLDPPTEAETT